MRTVVDSRLPIGHKLLASDLSCRMMFGKQCRLVSKSVPARAGLPGEQLKSAPRTGGFHQSVKLIRLARMLAPSSVQDRRVTTLDKHRLAPGGPQKMRPPPAEPH